MAFVETAEFKKKTRLRSTLTATLTSVMDFANSFNPTTSHRRITARLNELPSILAQFLECQEILETIDDRENGTQTDERLRFMDLYYDTKAKLEDILSTYNQNALKNVSLSDNNTGNSCNSDVVRLPAVPAPMFNGNVQDWAAFIDAFNAMFHNRVGLANVQKFHYLKSCLQGPAAEIIRTIPTTADNYEKAYEALVARYQNKGLIIQSHIRSLFDSPKVHHASALELRRLHHHIVSHVRALEAIGQPIKEWDAWLVTLICSRLDSVTVGEWQLKQTSRDLPTFSEIELFLLNRVIAYEAGEFSNQFNANNSNHRKGNEKKALIVKTSNQQTPNSTQKCHLCSGPHKLINCNQFIEMSLHDRKNIVTKGRLCFNCLYFGHRVAQCRFPPCSKCGRRHHEKLHNDSNDSTQVNSNAHSTEKPIVNTCNTVMYVSQNSIPPSVQSPQNVMLATAVVNVRNNSGSFQACRAVLDSGAQVNFMTMQCARRLNLNCMPTSVSIMGIGTTSSKTDSIVHTRMRSVYTDFGSDLDFHVLTSITNKLPSQSLDVNTLNIPSHVHSRIADPSFYIPSPIDLLIGAEIFFDLFNGERQSVSNHATMHNTELGWVLTGTTSVINTNSFKCSQDTAFTATIPRASTLALLSSHPVSRKEEESMAEAYFKKTTARDEIGRFVVRLPLNRDPSLLGNSLFMARQRFFNLERKFAKNPKLALEYQEFMHEYLAQGHMEPVQPIYGHPTYYLPHHAVFKDNSITTKIRVVFDGSAASSSGLSLNDIMVRGPTVQPDLLSIILRFRMHHVAITADIAKMYRQFRVATEDCDLQRICYRESPDQPLQHYRLLTVTYGTRSASFLATRCLAQIGLESENPETRRVITEDFYVDDLISGGRSDEECLSLYESVSATLNKAKLPLRKWRSSSKLLMSNIPLSHDDPTYMLDLTEQDMISALGLTWQPSSDSFRFLIKDWFPQSHMTKRTLLSDINRIYDPVGMILPILIKGKIFLQQLWSQHLGWDDLLPSDLQQRWTSFYTSLKDVNQIIIPRRVTDIVDSVITLHGFCDASQEAFGACIYVRSRNTAGTIQVRLLVSKSRVAPIKATTVPRLELCGAVLLAELVTHVKIELHRIGLNLQSSDIFLWTDSTIVLAWINSQSCFKVYVANRIAQILDLTQAEQWHHVPTLSNPADLITRGMHVSNLSSCSMWWHGPQFLLEKQSLWPKLPGLPTELLELRPTKLILAVFKEDIDPDWLLNRCSKWTKLLYVTAYIKRFIYNCKTRVSRTGGLTLSELQESKLYWLSRAQHSFFQLEIKALQKGTNVHRRSCLKSLSPYLDDSQLLRVGGRLSYSSISEVRKHPILLPAKCKITKMLFVYEHERLLHAGPQALLASIHLTYWPIRGKSLARQTVHKCIRCFRVNPNIVQPYMAPLPLSRVTQCRPFSKTGVDLCGPINIRSGIRRVTSIKHYIAVFICMVTRAIHLELVRDLSSDAFLSSLFRFMSRRGQ